MTQVPDRIMQEWCAAMGRARRVLRSEEEMSRDQRVTLAAALESLEGLVLYLLRDRDMLCLHIDKVERKMARVGRNGSGR